MRIPPHRSAGGSVGILLLLAAGCGGGSNGAMGPVPTILAVQPDVGSASGGTTVSIDGENFQEGAAVQFGSVFASAVVFNRATQLVVTVPADNPQPNPLLVGDEGAGIVTLTVNNPDGQSASFPNGFTYCECCNLGACPFSLSQRPSADH